MRKKTTKSNSRKPNPVRQAILVGLALVGIGIGYGMGFLFKKDTPVPPPEKIAHSETPPSPQAPATPPKMQAPGSLVAKPVLPESHSGEGKPRAYEEALPETIVHFPPITVPPPVKRDVIAPVEGPVATEQPFQGAKPTVPPALTVTPGEQDSASPKPPIKDRASLEPDQVQANQKPGPFPAVELGKGWLKNALVVPLTDKPKIAIVIDDMGVDHHRSLIASELTGPLTLSYLTYARNLEKQTRDARQAGHEIMLHVPMEPSSNDVDPGPNVLLSGVPAEETQAALNWGLDQFVGYVGVNNHMGSKFTSNLDGMKTLMRELHKRKVFFLDSVTSGSTKGQVAAQQFGVPFIARNIFLDHIDDIVEIRSRLNEVERLARKKGYAVAIGHPRDATIKALGPWLETIESQGFQLVPVSALIRLATSETPASILNSTKKEN